MLRLGALAMMAAAVFAVPAFEAAGQDSLPPAPETAPAPETPPAAIIDEEARDVLQKAADHAAALDLFAFDYRVHFALTGASIEQKSDALFRFTVARPVKAAVIGVEGLVGYAVVANGEQLYIHMPDVNAYTLEPPIAALTDFPGLMHLSAQVPLGGVSDILLLDNFYETLMGGVQELRYVGVEDVKGQPCHRLHFVEADFDWDLWIAAGDQPLIRKIVPDAAKQLAEVNAQMEGHTVSMDVLIEFDHWAVGGDVAQDVFVIAPPEGARKVDDFSEAAPQGDAPADGPQP